MLIARPRQLSALIDALLADSVFAPHIQAEQIGAAGFSAGGFTVLTLAGAKPEFGLLSQYCRKYPTDRNFCGPRQRRTARAGLTVQADARVRAVFAIAPVGVFFDRASLAPVTIPVYLYAAQKDAVLLPSENADRIRKDLPHPPEYKQVAGAGHYVFLAPCTSEQAAFIPNLCSDPPGVDRRAIHTRLNTDAVAFFTRVLAGLQ
ncbi:alpha/beta hydrolase family protein [Gloeobacter kilaueensis]|uniref:Dienelactone hydrolase n=1 Tax=Gloeobacter kilaueensis (strain ATCC BAA-2537 / CCAP 1431/1 / ULC 316 / JS1) TaxID=1183438 RepID=U5QGP9_GLOK1|nr:dienelactone hydrolase [Gloeobacter kilaueensis]AGY56805.1 dienelactone hydrolase [Gloeobacter kilaueensis JS1]